MKPILIRVFLSAVLASSISAVALAAPFDDEKISPSGPPAGATGSQGPEMKSQPESKLKKEKQKMKKEMQQKNKKKMTTIPHSGSMDDSHVAVNGDGFKPLYSLLPGSRLPG